MKFDWFLLILGFVTYLMVRRSVAGITRTPVWILWLVLMTPAIIWSTWTAVHGANQPLPPILIIGPFLVCPVLYWLLIQWGRRGLNLPASTQGQSQTSTPETVAESKPEPLPLRPIDHSEETQLRNCFPWSVFYIHNIEYRPQAVICRGQLRTTAAEAYQRIQENIRAEFGDRFLVVFQEGLNGKPFFALIPNPQAAKANSGRPKERLTRPGLALILLIVTLYTTTWVGAMVAGVSSKALAANPSLAMKGLPYALTLITILGIHELAHYLTARFYKIRSTLPYFIPVPFFLGTFGAFIQMRSPVPDRKALFDTGISGPLAGFVVTLPLFIWGLAHSTVVPLPDQSGILNPAAFNPRFSLLVALLSKLALGSQLTPAKAIALHPVAVAGYIGLVVTAFNLMPVGQLDGGHIVHAMFGQRTGAVIGQVSRLLLLSMCVLPPLFLGVPLIPPDFSLWAIILFFMPVADQPALNDVSELDNRRDFWGLLALGLLIAIILPAPNLLTQLLQI
jgi:membrane-associated protease RseP (regulator of RpoE activity)